MYSKDDIMELIQAGFTPDQIVSLSNMVPAPAPAPVPGQTPTGATMDDVMAGITALNAKMQNSMIQNSSQPFGGQPITSESILAQIINPSQPKSNNGGAM